MLPPAPARFSTTTCWPRLSPRYLATMRATVSVPPPGSKPTTMVTGCDGNGSWEKTFPAARSRRQRKILVMSFSGESRLALLHERLAAFLVVGAVEAFLHPSLAL